MFRNFSISSRITGGYVVVLVLLILIVADGLYAFRKISIDMDNLINKEMVFGQSIQNIRAEVGNLRRFEKDSFISIPDAGKQAEYYEKWQKSMSLARQSLAEAGKSADDKSIDMLTQLGERLKAYEQGYAKVYASLQSGAFATTADANKALSEYKDEIRATEDITKTLVHNMETRLVDGQSRLMSEVQMSTKLMLALGGLALVLAISVAWLVATSIRRPLAEICAHTEALARTRDLTLKLPELGRNEIGRVGESLNALLATIRDLIAESHDHSARLVNAADRLSSVNDSITDAATRQSLAASSSAAAIEQLTVSVNHMADNAADVEGQVRNTSRAAEDGNRQAEFAKQQIERIADSIAKTSHTMDALNQRSNEIGDIVRVIHDIADQTNLLALNAAIEAARAGELGRGFAVVADEVRKLAERTTSATNEITERIRAVQDDTARAYGNMQEASGMISSGVEETRKVSEALTNIHHYSQDAVGKVSEMAIAVKEQSVASLDIARNVEQIAQMNDNTRLSVEEAAELAADLKRQSGELDSSISNFRV